MRDESFRTKPSWRPGRTPFTTSARSSAASSRGRSAGSFWRSASSVATTSPRAASKPAAKAAVWPLLAAKRSTRTRSSRSARSARTARRCRRGCRRPRRRTRRRPAPRRARPTARGGAARGCRAPRRPGTTTQSQGALRRAPQQLGVARLDHAAQAVAPRDPARAELRLEPRHVERQRFERLLGALELRLEARELAEVRAPRLDRGVLAARPVHDRGRHAREREQPLDVRARSRPRAAAESGSGRAGGAGSARPPSSSSGDTRASRRCSRTARRGARSWSARRGLRAPVRTTASAAILQML